MPYLDAAELPTSPQLFIERRKIKKKSANLQIFLHLFLKIIAFKTKLKHVINAVKEKPKFDYKSEENLSPLIKSLIGVLPQHDDADEFDYKKARMEYLTDKYGL